MKIFKKFLTAFLFVFLLIGVGCTNSEQSNQPENPPVEEENEEQIDLSAISFTDLSVEYDGQSHSIEVNNLPEELDVVYENNDKINAGEYVVTAKISKDNEELKSLTATLTITKRNARVIIDDQQSAINNIKQLTYTTEGVLPNEDLGVELTVDSSTSGKKEIKGTWSNSNYNVTFTSGVYTITESLFNSSSMTANSAFLPNYAPFSFYDTSLFEESVITKISFPFYSFATGYDKYSSNLYVPIYVVKSDFTTKQSECTVENGKLIKLDLTNKLLNVKQGDWVTVENLNIVVGKGETLAFGDTNMTVMPGFLRNDGTYGFWNRIFSSKGANNHSLIFNIEGYRTGSSSSVNNGFVEDDIDYISFLGDSISTYSGISNSTSYNSTIGSNAIWYPNNNYSGANLSPADTWWNQTANELGYQLCVNNSWSGSVVNTAQTYNIRAKNLHNNEMHAPDIIVIFIGVNDYAANTAVGSYDGTTTPPASPKNFSEAYGKMLDNIKKTYPNAEVFCCTFLSDRKRMNTDVNGAGISIDQYLNAIKTIAGNMNVNIIDLYNNSGITGDTINIYTVDKLHPNAVGMDLITFTVVDAITKVLEEKE